MNTGGPAFPYSWWDEQTGANAIAKGMTLRDYFAAKAMQSIVSVLHKGIRPADITTMCDDSYTIADAMLKAREQ